jgi:hypothetical protein
MKDGLNILRAVTTAVLLALVISSCGKDGGSGGGSGGSGGGGGEGTTTVSPSSGFGQNGFEADGLCEPEEAKPTPPTP